MSHILWIDCTNGANIAEFYEKVKTNCQSNVVISESQTGVFVMCKDKTEHKKVQKWAKNNKYDHVLHEHCAKTFQAHHCIAKGDKKERKDTASGGSGIITAGDASVPSKEGLPLVQRVPPSNLPSVMAKHYSYPTQVDPDKPPKIAIISLGGSIIRSDLNYVYEHFVPNNDVPLPSRFKIVDLGGEETDLSSSNSAAYEENALDVQIVLSMCPASLITLYIAPNSFNGFLYAINQAISDRNKIISISWGAPETVFGSRYLNIYNRMFATALSKGIAVCVASGDTGSSDGTNRATVDFPASSPNVIACGGTSLVDSSNEKAWSWHSRHGWGGGGGVSSHFKASASQRKMASLYPNKSNTPGLKLPKGLKFTNQRSVPDIAMNADPLSGWTIYFNGTLYVNQFGGTSCVSPAFSAFLGLINWDDYSGVIDWLYTAPNRGFKDITSGTNDNIPNTKGVYSCRSGYDQCTGRGSIRGNILGAVPKVPPVMSPAAAL